MYYLRSRYYSTNLCRFLNPDALLGRSAVLNHNLFSYCVNSPVICEDSSGKAWKLLLLLTGLLSLTGCSRKVDTFSTELEAVEDFANKYIDDELEYATTIMRTPQGRYYYTPPNCGEIGKVKFSMPTENQFYTDTIVAQCHSHPNNGDPGMLLPSIEDVIVSLTSSICARYYVVTPEDGIFLMDKGQKDALLDKQWGDADDMDLLMGFDIKILRGRYQDNKTVNLRTMSSLLGQ